MKNILLIYFCGLIILSNFQVTSAQAAAPANAPDFSGKAIYGRFINFSVSSQKKPTLLVFWASWCRYCIAEIPRLKTLYDQNKQLRILGVNVNINSEDGLAVEKNHHLPYPSIADPTLKISDAYEVHGTPMLILVNTQGEIAHRSRRLNDSLLSKINNLTL